MGARDRLLELLERCRQVRSGQLAQRLGREVLMRCPPGRVRALAGRYDQPRRVLLGGDHHERAAVELAGGLGAVDELPQPLDGLLAARAGRRSRSAARRLAPSLRVLVTSVRNSSITSRIPETASRATRSPLWVYGESS